MSFHEQKKSVLIPLEQALGHVKSPNSLNFNQNSAKHRTCRSRRRKKSVVLPFKFLIMKAPRLSRKVYKERNHVKTPSKIMFETATFVENCFRCVWYAAVRPIEPMNWWHIQPNRANIKLNDNGLCGRGRRHLQFRVLWRELFQYRMIQRIKCVDGHGQNDTQRTAQSEAQEIGVDDACVFMWPIVQDVVDALVFRIGSGGLSIAQRLFHHSQAVFDDGDLFLGNV